MERMKKRVPTEAVGCMLAGAREGRMEALTHGQQTSIVKEICSSTHRSSLVPEDGKHNIIRRRDPWIRNNRVEGDS